MLTQHSMFKTPEGQARYLAAYDATLALWPVPVESVDVPTRFGNTHVNACGPEGAPPLLLLHAFAISSTMWYPNVAELSRSYRIYALDTIGDKGKSVSARPILTPLDFVTWLSDVFDELRLEEAHVAGLSFGGFLALNLALSAPERVTRLVLLAPVCLLPIRPQFYFRLAAAILLPFLSFKFKQELSLGLASTHAAPALKQFLTPKDFRFDYNKVFIPPVYTDNALQQIKAPTLLLLGEREVIYDPKAALKRAANLIPNIETRLITGAGHALNFDQPEMVNMCILEFLNKEVGSPEGADGTALGVLGAGDW